MKLPPLYLKSREERRLRAGHLWLYSNEVDVERSPLQTFEPGQAVAILASSGRFLGNGYVNPHSLICARLVSRNAEHWLNKSLIVHRLNVALSLRQRLFEAPFYRFIYGESDGLPGLVVDRYDQVLVVQMTTAGMERAREDIIAALQHVLRPAAVLLRNDTSIRALEGLDSYVEPVLGSVPATVRLQENGAVFDVPLMGGQKTGWFFDQRMNRARLAPYVSERQVLDAFSYTGSWGIQAAVRGAGAVTCVEASERAVDLIRTNAELNGVGARVTTVAEDAFAVLRRLRAESRRFDVVILDPPAFIKRKKDYRSGAEAYQRLNQMAMSLLFRDGMLITSSCSYHLPRSAFLGLLQRAAVAIDREIQVVEQGHQGPDHPIHPAIVETAYLKTFFLRVLPRR